MATLLRYPWTAAIILKASPGQCDPLQSHQQIMRLEQEGLMEPLIEMMAAAQSEEDSRLSGIAARCPSLICRLQKFHFPSIAQPLAGLLTLPANDPAHVRLSALLHLAAMFCHGHKDPTLAQLREWLNDILLKECHRPARGPGRGCFCIKRGDVVRKCPGLRCGLVRE
jgi:hypothetical protein